MAQSVQQLLYNTPTSIHAEGWFKCFNQNKWTDMYTYNTITLLLRSLRVTVSAQIQRTSLTPSPSTTIEGWFKTVLNKLNGLTQARYSPLGTPLCEGPSLCIKLSLIGWVGPLQWIDSVHTPLDTANSSQSETPSLYVLI